MVFSSSSSSLLYLILIFFFLFWFILKNLISFARLFVSLLKTIEILIGKKNRKRRVTSCCVTCCTSYCCCCCCCCSCCSCNYVFVVQNATIRCYTLFLFHLIFYVFQIVSFQILDFGLPC